MKKVGLVIRLISIIRIISLRSSITDQTRNEDNPIVRQTNAPSTSTTAPAMGKSMRISSARALLSWTRAADRVPRTKSKKTPIAATNNTASNDCGHGLASTAIPALYSSSSKKSFPLARSLPRAKTKKKPTPTMQDNAVNSAKSSMTCRAENPHERAPKHALPAKNTSRTNHETPIQNSARALRAKRRAEIRPKKNNPLNAHWAHTMAVRAPQSTPYIHTRIIPAACTRLSAIRTVYHGAVRRNAKTPSMPGVFRVRYQKD